MKPSDQLRLAWMCATALRAQWWSAERIRRCQERRLVGVMQHAVRHVPFYRGLGLDARDLNNAADLMRFPLLTKSDLQRDPAAFIADGLQAPALPSSRTSGSTGQPTTTYFDRECWLLTKYALKMRRVLAATGFSLRQRVLIVSEARAEELAALHRAAPGSGGLFFRQRHVSIHAPVAEHLGVVREFRPTAIYAYPSYLLDLVAELAGGRAPRTVIPVIFSSSEVLTPHARAAIETGLGGRVFDIYGSTEFKEVAWQCGYGRFHWNFESVYVEPLPDAASAQITTSTLCNRAMPLLRYRVGDLGRGDSRPCACGRASVGLGAIAGREGDMIELPGGRRLSPYLLTTVIESDPDLLQYRIVETAPATFRIDRVRRPNAPTTVDARVLRDLSAVAGERACFSLNDVAEVTRSRSGKRSVFVRDGAGQPPQAAV